MIAALIAFASRRKIRRATAAAGPDPACSKDAQADAAAAMGELLGSEAAGWIHGHPLHATGLALIAGFAVGLSPELSMRLRYTFKRAP